MFFVVDPDTEVAPQHAAFVWQRLWEMRDLAPIGAVMPAVVSSPCPLLPDETANALLVATLTQVPAGSAWVPLEVDLVRYARRDGEIREALLDAALQSRVEEGERLHDETRWADPGQDYDSRNNRRLSVFVRGWGDLVAIRGCDPASLDTLREVEALADRIAGVLGKASRDIANANGYCPAIDITGARVLHHGPEMNALWRHAVMNNGLRHRNLLTISPWDVFPRGVPATFRYMNLLPVLRKAHSVSMCRDADIAHWHAADFRAFHERVGAILRNTVEAPPVAHRL
jgi:hypothetical protein